MDPEHIFVFKDDNTVIRTNEDGGNRKKLFISKSKVLNFIGLGQLATVADFKKKFNNMAGWEKVK